jgi:aspartyl-tRNA(Asn)/glutamyl-tRNA(Gln) amidotransferase subunit A
VTLAGVFITELDPPADGPTLAIKDLFDTAGVRTTYGSAIYRDHVPATTAEAVTRLERAGYACVGKANLHEFAWGITSENPHYGTVPNPLAAGRIAGGSSGGCAAALAAGLADAALGSDSGGSVRIPAACCGVTGFKPTFGLVPIDGCFPLAPSFDTAGPMARDVDGCERMMAALAPELDAVALDSLADLRVGVAWTHRADALVRARVEAAAARFPHRQPLDLPMPDAVGPAFAREAAEVHGKLFGEHRELYGDGTGRKVQRALEVSDAEAQAATHARDRYRERLAELTAEVDLVLTPTLVSVAPRTGIGDRVLVDRMTALTFPWNAIGAAALALPCGPAEDGLPASVQLAGRPGDDAIVLAAGRLLEHALTDEFAAPQRS